MIVARKLAKATNTHVTDISNRLFFFQNLFGEIVAASWAVISLVGEL